jgi:hypothetical protein
LTHRAALDRAELNGGVGMRKTLLHFGRAPAWIEGNIDD